MDNKTQVLFADHQVDSIVRACNLLIKTKYNGMARFDVSTSIEMICRDFIARYSKPEDMTNIVPFERDAKQRQPQL